LENERILQQFDEIEKKVEKLIEAKNAVEAANDDLRSENQRLTDELRGKVEAEKSYHEERNLIRSKIDNLLVRLEEMAENP
jgi:hypothetical protein